MLAYKLCYAKLDLRVFYPPCDLEKREKVMPSGSLQKSYRHVAADCGL